MITRLYSELNAQLRYRVAAAVPGSHAVFEDACQFAWTQLLLSRDPIALEATSTWLAMTATREALRLLRLQTRDVSLEAEIEHRGDQLLGGPASDPDELTQRRERLARLRDLPLRQQRILWLKAIGLSQHELAAHERCTNRTIDRQLARARSRLRAEAA